MLYPGNVNNVERLRAQQLLASLGNSAELQPVDVSAVRAPYEKLRPATAQPNWNQTPQGVLGNSVQNFARGLAISATSAPLPDIGSNIDFAYGVTPEQITAMTQVLQERQKARADAELARRSQMSGQLTNIAQGVDQARALGLDERKVQLAETQIPQEQLGAANAEAGLIAQSQTQDRQLQSALIQNEQQVIGQGLLYQQKAAMDAIATPQERMKYVANLAQNLIPNIRAGVYARNRYVPDIDATDREFTAKVEAEVANATFTALTASGASAQEAYYTLGLPVPQQLVNSLATNPQNAGTAQTQVPPSPQQAPPSTNGVQPPDITPVSPAAAGSGQPVPAQTTLQAATPENAPQPDIPPTTAQLTEPPAKAKAEGAGYEVKPSLVSRIAKWLNGSGGAVSNAMKVQVSPEDAATLPKIIEGFRPFFKEGTYAKNKTTGELKFMTPQEIASLLKAGDTSWEPYVEAPTQTPAQSLASKAVFSNAEDARVKAERESIAAKYAAQEEAYRNSLRK